MADKYFLVKNNLVQEPKHKDNLGMAIYLYLNLLSYANRSETKDKTLFYLSTYCKAMNETKDQVLSELQLLTFNAYIGKEMLENGVYLVKILKPIKTGKWG